jgi:hypothetical protein
LRAPSLVTRQKESLTVLLCLEKPAPRLRGDERIRIRPIDSARAQQQHPELNIIGSNKN